MANGGKIDLFTPSNPTSPYLAIKIDDRVYDLTVNFIKSLKVHRATDTLGTFEFTLVDTMDLNLEAKFMKLIMDETNDLSFQYGWAEGSKSPWYWGKIRNYNPSFHSNFNLTLTATGELSPEGPKNRVMSYKGNSISDIVAQVCDREGWNLVELDQTDPFTEERQFVQGNMPSIDFIREKLEPEALVKGSPVTFYLTTDADGAKAYFVAVDKHINNIKRNYNFLINAGNYGSVISFDPAYDGSMVAVVAEEAGFFDSETNEISVYGSEASAAAKETDLTIYGSTTPDKMKALLANKWYAKNVGMYNATLVIWGDPHITPMDYINIMPMRPDGTIHHTGGTYQVIEAIDEVAGSFTTTLTLVKANYKHTGGTMPFEEVISLKNKE